MTDRLNITIRLADLAPIPLQINRDEEPAIRTAEYNLNRLWQTWSGRYKDKTSHEVLGMVAFQFAKTFVMFNMQAEQTNEMLKRLETTLDEALTATDESVKL